MFNFSEKSHNTLKQMGRFSILEISPTFYFKNDKKNGALKMKEHDR